jgi:cyanophycin synthetase
VIDASRDAFRAVRKFDGPNRLHSRPVFVAEVRLLGGEHGPVDALAQRLSATLGRQQPSCVAERLPSLPPLDAAASAGTVGALIAQTAIVLQRWVGLPVRFSASLGADARRGTERIAFEFVLARLAGRAGAVAAELVRGAAAGRSREAKRALDLYIEKFVLEPPGAIVFITQAEARGIPWRAVIESEGIIDFGEGRRQRRLWRHFTGATSYLATKISTRKDAANAVLGLHGLPVPRQELVTTEGAALRAARRIGPPVVIKPASTDFGTAVHLDVSGDAAVRSAFATARKHGPVLVEEQIPGDHFRLMVINGRLTSVRRQKPAHVVADGVRSIAKLVDAANATRIRNGWVPIPLDAEARQLLAGRGLAPESVPAAGSEVRLRVQSNLSEGGSMEVLTDLVHPDNARLALRAAAIVGIDVAGLDFITPDITRSYLEVGGGICEINVTPGLILGEQAIILEDWFPRGDTGRIPLFVLLDPPEDGNLGRSLVSMISRKGVAVSHASNEGVRLGEATLARGNLPGRSRARIALGEPGAAAAVLELQSDDVLENGVSFNRCDVLIAGRAGAAKTLLSAIAGKVLALEAVSGEAKLLEELSASYF